MAAYSLDTLLKRWSLNQLTTEQAIGQILQFIQQLEARVKRLEPVSLPPKAKPRRRSSARPASPPASQAPQRTKQGET